jgi:hypothetical protein
MIGTAPNVLSKAERVQYDLSGISGLPSLLRIQRVSNLRVQELWPCPEKEFESCLVKI